MMFSRKLCIVSHILPPSPSGQAMVLYRLLSGQKPFNYCLVSAENPQTAGSEGATSALDAPHYQLACRQGIPFLHKMGSETVRILLDSLYRIYRFSRQLKHIVEVEGCTAIIACSGDPFDLPAAYLASIYLKVPLIPYMFDDYLYQWTGPYRTLARLFARRIMRASAAVIVPNERLQREYEIRYGVTSAVLHNPCIMNDYILPDQGDGHRRPELDKDFVNIVYTGSVYHAHYDAFRNLLRAIEITARTDIMLHVYTAQSESQLAAAGLTGTMLQVHRHVPAAEIPSILNQADILFLPLAFESSIPEVIKTSAPGKTGEYLAVGKPILVHAPRDSFLAEYFTKNSCGLVVDENDPLILSVALLKMLENSDLRHELGVTARNQAGKDFDLEKVKQDFLAIVTGSRVEG